LPSRLHFPRCLSYHIELITTDIGRSIIRELGF
jgi:hypothetical protein